MSISIYVFVSTLGSYEMGRNKESIIILLLLFKTAQLQLVYCGCIVVFRGTHIVL